MEMWSPRYKEKYGDCKRKRPSELFTKTVPGKPLEDYMADHDMKTVTWISADCEGCETEFIRNFNFTKYDVQLFNFETNSAVEPHLKELLGILAGHGFKKMYDPGDNP